MKQFRVLWLVVALGVAGCSGGKKRWSETEMRAQLRGFAEEGLKGSGRVDFVRDVTVASTDDPNRFTGIVLYSGGQTHYWIDIDPKTNIATYKPGASTLPANTLPGNLPPLPTLPPLR